MLQSSKTAKITRETSRQRRSLISGMDPSDVGMCAYTRGWASASGGDPDEMPTLGKKTGWIARFDRGASDARKNQIALASAPTGTDADEAPADNECHCEVACHHDA